MDGRSRTRSVQYMELERGTAKELRRILEASGGTRETPVKLHIKSLLPLWLLVTMPNLNSLRRLEVAFFRTVFVEILRPPLLALVPEAGLRMSGSDVRGSPQT